MDEFLRVMERLLGENGCPWDKEQTHESLKPYMIEECYEVLDAIDKQDMTGLCEELGDVLLQVVFHAKLAEKAGLFTFKDVAAGVTNKMVSRHPHIFSDVVADTPEEVLRNWEEIKKEEKHQASATEVLRAVPRNLPALMYANKVVKKALRTDEESFSVDGAADMLEALAKTLRAGEGAKNPQFVEKYGRTLLDLGYISAILQINPEFALTNAVETYINKFEDIERAHTYGNR